jgi:hypothetical protein
MYSRVVNFLDKFNLISNVKMALEKINPRVLQYKLLLEKFKKF